MYFMIFASGLPLPIAKGGWEGVNDLSRSSLQGLLEFASISISRFFDIAHPTDIGFP